MRARRPQTSPAIAIDREKCIKCGRCVEVCQDVQVRRRDLIWSDLI